MKYHKGQLVKFHKWVGISPSFLKPNIRSFRRDVSVTLSKQSLGIIVEVLPIPQAWRLGAENQNPKHCYIVQWQGEYNKKLMYEPEITKTN